jgi:hypothetical protein
MWHYYEHLKVINYVRDLYVRFTNRLLCLTLRLLSLITRIVNCNTPDLVVATFLFFGT